eukprot:SAG22_NODE_629_length_8389_cov_6.069723_8_plen_56_part_00
MNEKGMLVYEGEGEDKVLVSGPNYYQFIENDDWSKVFLDLDDGDPVPRASRSLQQ